MSNYTGDQQIIYSINPDTKLWNLNTSNWLEQVGQLQSDADSKTALLDSNAIIFANQLGLLSTTLSVFQKIKMNYQVNLQEIVPHIGENVKLLTRENVEIIYNNVSDELNNLISQAEKFNTDTLNNDQTIIAMTKSDNSSAVHDDQNMNNFLKITTIEIGKLICQNYKGEEFTFSKHSLRNLGDGWLSYQSANEGKDQVFVITNWHLYS
ncbi:MAG: hypothetical protein ABH896_04065 [Candidatus Jacksonbacteria bacterium]